MRPQILKPTRYYTTLHFDQYGAVLPTLTINNSEFCTSFCDGPINF